MDGDENRYSTFVDMSEICGRCEATGASRQIIAGGPAELYRDDYLCDDCADIVSKQTGDWLRWMKRKKVSE